MRTLSIWQWMPLVTLLLCAGCTRNPNAGNPFAMGSTGQPYGTNPNASVGLPPFASGPLVSIPGGSPSNQVRDLENWRNSAVKQYERLQSQVATLSQRNGTLESQITNARKHAKLQDQHLTDISGRLKQSTAELAQLRSRDQQDRSSFQNLDRVNQEKERQLATARRDVQRLESQLARAEHEREKMQQQLTTLTRAKADAEKTSETLLAASRRRSGASITPNTNISLPDISIPGVDVRRDGEVLRIPLLTDDTFELGTVQFRPGTVDRLRRIAYDVSRAFPDQRIGIEGHTDGSSSVAGPWRNDHHLSSAQAMAVYEFLAGQGIFTGNQLHVVGHGSNYPVFSSATADGRRGNRRVELVIYPETIGATPR